MIFNAPLIKAALCADSLNLGSHWVYNQAKLTRTFPDGVMSLTAPLTDYHPGKAEGDLTHYGDNIALMLRAHALTGQWDHALFVHAWQAFWKESESYKDDHGDEETVDSAEFFTRVVLLLRQGQAMSEAMEQAAQAGYAALDAGAYLTRVKEALTRDDHLKVAAGFGLTCHNPEAFPLTLYYLLRNPSNSRVALSENALAGGDNAARGIIIGILFAAAQVRDDSLDSHWENLTQYQELQALLVQGSRVLSPGLMLFLHTVLLAVSPAEGPLALRRLSPSRGSRPCALTLRAWEKVREIFRRHPF